MADSHYAPSPAKSLGASMVQALRSLEDSRESLIRHRLTMIQMRDGDGSVAGHYATVTAEYGFASDADSKSAFDEIDSCLFKLTTDSSVTSVDAALRQLFSRLRT